MKVRGGTKRRELLHGLMRRAVFAQADRVMGKNIQHPLTHQRRHPQRIARILHEDQECRTVGDKPAVQCNAIHNGGHRKLAHTVVEVITGGRLRRDSLCALPQRQVGSRQICGPTQ